MTWTSVPTQVAGYAPLVTDWNTLIRDNLNAGAWVTLGTTTLSGSAASFDFTSITGTFAHLRVIAYLRGDTAASTVNIVVRMNNDSAANYDYQYLYGQAATTNALETFGSTGFLFARAAPAASGPANLFAGYEMVIPHYANSANNKAFATSSYWKGGTTTTMLSVAREAGFWRSNSAITRITISPNTGNFVAGSAATILGLP